MTHNESQTPRVLQVVGAMNVGGAETMLMDLYRAVDRSRVQFDFLVYSDEVGAYDEEIVRLGGRLIRVSPPQRRGLRRATEDIRKVLRGLGPFRAVHAHVLHASAFSVRAAAAEGVPIRIAHSHNTGDVAGRWTRRVYMRWARRAIIRHATELVACGSDAGAYLFGEDASWRLLRNGVDLGRFKPATLEEQMAARAAMNIPNGDLTLGAVARFEPVKNHEFLVVLAQALADQGVAFRMLLAGEGSRRAALEEQVRRRGLAEHVRFLGLWSDVPGLLAALDGLLMPSHYEGIPVALMEAQAAGVPCLVSDAVSRETDLAIGLADFLPIDAVEPWLAAVDRLAGRRLGPGCIIDKVRAAGADVQDSADLLYGLYDLNEH